MIKALQITGPGQFSIVETDIPKIAENDILVEIEIAATCPRWDIHMMKGIDMFDSSAAPAYPLPIGQPGHEMAGTVTAVGNKVKKFQVGDRVAALEHLSGNGAYAEYLTYKENELIKLPENVSFKQAVSFELLKCVIIGLSQFDDVTDKSIVISGLGPAGILAMQVAKIWGASEVVGIDINPKRIEYVQSLGIGKALHTNELKGLYFDLGFDCVGYAESVQNILNHINHHLVIFGVLKGEVHFGEKLWGRGIRLETYGARTFTEKDQKKLLDTVDKGLNTECIQTHHIPLKYYNKVIDKLLSQQALKVYFYPKNDLKE